MGKKQHQKDKLYLTTTEWKESYGGCRDETILKAQQAKFQRLPFDCCCISLQPFDYPVCSSDGHIFDITYILPFLKKYGVNPVTGEKLNAKSLVRLNFHKNAENAYHCPATYRVFTNTSHVVAIRQSGNVYSYEAVDELNLKIKNFKDLLSDEPFTRKDIITLQDPHNQEKFNISNFYHVKMKLNFCITNEKTSNVSNLRNMNLETKETLLQLEKDYVPKTEAEKQIIEADAINAAHYSTGAVAAGFTSTVMEPITRHQAAVIDEDLLKYRRTSKKGYVRLFTNLGHLNFELHCDLTPRACDNFLRHCSSGYYDQTKFHRLIKNFMIQGGDPSATGNGGESSFGKPFEDEFASQLSHEGRGILSMANRGTNTNTSQFFITFRSCKHLDRKHTIFGRLVGGFDTLTAIERIPTDSHDKPQEDIKILSVEIFVNPFDDAVEQLKSEREALKKNKESEQKNIMASRQKLDVRNVYKSGIGKYIDPSHVLGKVKKSNNEDEQVVVKKRKVNSDPWGSFC